MDSSFDTDLDEIIRQTDHATLQRIISKSLERGAELGRKSILKVGFSQN